MARYRTGMGRLFRSKINGREVGSWKFKFQGRDISTGAKSKRQAGEFQRQFLGQRKRAPKGTDALTIADLIALVRRDYERKKFKTLDKLTSRTKNIEAVLGHLRAHSFRAADLDSYIDRREADGMSPATINRELETLCRGFKIAIAKELMDWQPKITMLPVQNVRDIDLTPAEYRKLKAELREPVKLLFLLAYHIGWRAGQLIGLKWSQVEFENDLIRRPANQSATKWVGTAPIYGDLTRALLVAKAEHEKYWPHVPWVLHRAGTQVKTYRAEWKRARKEIGRTDLHFHDVRHAAVTNMIEAGIDENRVMEIVGHKTQAMLNRYTIRADRHVQEAGRKMEDYFERIRPRDDPKRTVQ